MTLSQITATKRHSEMTIGIAGVLSRQEPLPQALAQMRLDIPDTEILEDPLNHLFPKDDIRSELAKIMHSFGEYRFPKASRSSMIVELMAHKMAEKDGQLYPSWDIRMNFKWNQSGKIADGREISPQNDEKWADLIENDPSIFHDACERALSPYIDDFVDILEQDGTLSASIDLLEPCRETLILTSFKSEALGFASRAVWTDHVKSLSDEDLCDLWMSVRVLDADFSKKSRAEIMAGIYNDIRHEKEEIWENDYEDLSF